MFLTLLDVFNKRLSCLFLLSVGCIITPRLPFCCLGAGVWGRGPSKLSGSCCPLWVDTVLLTAFWENSECSSTSTKYEVNNLCSTYLPKEYFLFSCQFIQTSQVSSVKWVFWLCCETVRFCLRTCYCQSQASLQNWVEATSPLVSWWMLYVLFALLPASGGTRPKQRVWLWRPSSSLIIHP